MSIASQVVDVVELARRRHPTDAAIQGAADSVEAALAPSSWRQRTWGEGGRSACVGYQRADASVWARTVAWRLANCDPWATRLVANLPVLAGALRNAGDAAGAEAVDAITDAQANLRAEREDIPPRNLGDALNTALGRPRPDPDASWWDSMPREVRFGVGVLAVWFALDAATKIGEARGAFR